MLFPKTMIFRCHIAFLLLLTCPYEVTSSNHHYTPNSSNELLRNPLYDPANRSFSVEPLEIVNNPTPTKSITDHPISMEPSLLFNFNKHNNQQLDGSTINNSLQHFDTTSIIQDNNPLNDTVSISQSSPWGSSLRNLNTVPSQYSQFNLSFHDAFSGHLDNLSLSVPSFCTNNQDNLSLSLPSFFPNNADNLSLSVPSFCTNNQDNLSLSLPSPLPSNLEISDCFSQLPSLPTVHESNQLPSLKLSNLSQQNNPLNDSVINPIAKNKSRKKKSTIIKEKKKSVKPKTKNPKKFACQYCNKKFTRKDNKKSHEKRHINPKPFQCKACGKKLSTKYYLDQHMRIHNGTLYRCDYCDKSYTAKNALKKHQKIHTGEKPFVCSNCNKRFRSRHDWCEHEKTHEPQVRYPCSFCDKTFKREQNCTYHIDQVHLNKRLYECQTCGQSFKRKDGLKKHQKNCKG